MSKKTMSEELAASVANMSTMQRTYAEWRAKGMTQAEAASKAGSKAEGRASLSRVGFQLETSPGVKEYIEHLHSERSGAEVIDSIEVINMFMKIYEESMKQDKLKEATKAAELIGAGIGMFKNTPAGKISTQDSATQSKVEIAAFREDDEISSEEKVIKLQELLKGFPKTDTQ
jgi:phage terminase small subunit